MELASAALAPGPASKLLAAVRAHAGLPKAVDLTQKLFDGRWRLAAGILKHTVTLALFGDKWSDSGRCEHLAREYASPGLCDDLAAGLAAAADGPLAPAAANASAALRGMLMLPDRAAPAEGHAQPHWVRPVRKIHELASAWLAAGCAVWTELQDRAASVVAEPVPGHMSLAAAACAVVEANLTLAEPVFDDPERGAAGASVFGRTVRVNGKRVAILGLPELRALAAAPAAGATGGSGFAHLLAAL